MLKHRIAFTTIGFAMLTATAMAQTSAPSPSAPSPGMNSTPSASSTSAPKAGEQNLAGQGKWRASKLMGVDVYGADNTKVGDVTEVLFDKTGKIDMVTVGVGGFLGIGAKDVAIPFDQIQWSDQPMAAAAPAPAPSSTGGMAGSSTASGGMASSTTTASATKAPEMYPDHGKINMTKDQLSAAPAVTYAAR